MRKAMRGLATVGATAIALTLMAGAGAGATLGWSGDHLPDAAPPVPAFGHGLRRLSLDPDLIGAGPGGPHRAWRSYGALLAGPARESPRDTAPAMETWLLIGAAAPLDLVLPRAGSGEGIGRAGPVRLPETVPSPVPLPGGALLLLTGLAALCLAGRAASLPGA